MTLSDLAKNTNSRAVSLRHLSFLYLGLMKFYIKNWRTYSWVSARHNYSCISNEACVAPLSETFYLNDETETVSRMEKAGPFDCCCIHHSIGIAVSLLASGLTVDILSTFCAHSFYSLVCWVNAEKFWIWGFNVWPFCISPKCNISGTFHQVRALLSCLLNGLQIS